MVKRTAERIPSSARVAVGVGASPAVRLGASLPNGSAGTSASVPPSHSWTTLPASAVSKDFSTIVAPRRMTRSMTTRRITARRAVIVTIRTSKAAEVVPARTLLVPALPAITVLPDGVAWRL